MYIVKYLERVHMARMRELASASPPYEQVPNILRYLTNLITIRNGNLPYVVQNERYASSGVSVLISFARISIISLNSPFL